MPLNLSITARALSPRRRPAMRGLLAVAVALVPLLSHAAAAQQRDRSSAMSFRTEVSDIQTRLAYPPDAVWTVLAQVYAKLHFPTDRVVRTDQREYRTPFMEVRGRLFDKPNGEFFSCQGGDILADLTNTGQISFALRSVVRPDDGGGSVVATQVDARARRRGTSGSAIECASTGNLERGLAQTIKQQLDELAAQQP
jgi:hypothetical protein